MNEADPRVKRTRKLLLEAFSKLLREKGSADLLMSRPPGRRGPI